MSTPICFLDCETTGLHADRRPWEIAIIRRDENGQTETTIQISDVDLSGAELIGLNIGRFYDRHLNYGNAEAEAHDKNDEHLFLTESAAAREVEHLTRGAHIVGSVPNFDTETLAAMLRRHGLCPAWHYHLIDVETLAIGWLYGQRVVGKEGGTWYGEYANGEPVQLPWNSGELSLTLGVVPPTEQERHTAMGDARWAMRLYDHILVAPELPVDGGAE